MDFLPVFERTGSLLLIIAAGFLAGACKLIDETGRRQLNHLLLTLFSPLMVLDTFSDKAGDADAAALSAMLPRAILTGFGLIAAGALFGCLLCPLLRIEKQQRPLYIFMTAFGNYGFTGFPVISAVFAALWGADSVPVGLLFGAMLVCCFQILVYTGGVLLFTGGHGTFKLGPLLRSPAVLSCAAGILLLVFRLPLPGLLAYAADSVGGLTGPVSLLLIGMQLTDIAPRELIRDRRALLFTVLRQLALPLLLAPLIRLAVPAATANDQLLQATMLVESTMPAGATALSFALEYNGDAKLASKVILLTTVLSACAVPLFTMLFFL